MNTEIISVLAFLFGIAIPGLAVLGTWGIEAASKNWAANWKKWCEERRAKRWREAISYSYDCRRCGLHTFTGKGEKGRTLLADLTACPKCECPREEARPDTANNLPRPRYCRCALPSPHPKFTPTVTTITSTTSPRTLSFSGKYTGPADKRAVSAWVSARLREEYPGEDWERVFTEHVCNYGGPDAGEGVDFTWRYRPIERLRETVQDY